jgi:hypothetical protein
MRNIRVLVDAVLCATLNLFSAAPLYAEEPLFFQEAQDLQVSTSEELSGLIAVTLEGSGDRNEMRFIDLDTGRALKPRFLTEPVIDGSVSALYDGLIFAKIVGTKSEIYWSELDGRSQRILSNSSRKKYSPAWEGAGSSVVFVEEFNLWSKELFRTPLEDSAASRQLTQFGSRNTTPHVNPLTNVIAYSTSRNFPGWDVCFFNPDSGVSTCPLGDSKDSFCRPKWSNDGLELVFSKGVNSAIDLFIYNVASQTTRRLTSLPNKEYDGAWSPQGKYIVFSHNPAGGEIYDLKAVRVSDGAVFPIATSTRSMRSATWTQSKTYSLLAPTPTPLPATTPTVEATPPTNPTAEPTSEVEPSPTAAPESPTPPRVVYDSSSPTKIRLNVIMDDERTRIPKVVRIQINKRVIERHTLRRVLSLSVKRGTVVRASWRSMNQSTFSDWSPWTRAEREDRSRTAY